MRTIGILLDLRTWKGIPRRRTGHEKISFYNKAARKLNLSPFYFSLNHLEPNLQKAKGYIFSNGRYALTVKPTPKVIHNRSMTSFKGWRERLKRLSKRSIVFNAQTRYTKYKVHQLLVKRDSLKPHLPYTKRFSKSSLEKMMKRFKELYIKPSNGSIGKGIIKVAEDQNGCWTIQASKKVHKKQKKKVYGHLRKRVGHQSYLIQEAIPLACHKGRPFDIRVSVQKSGEGKWQVTGMVGKVAGIGKHVTNVARGGSVKDCEKLFVGCGLDVKQTKQTVKEFSLKVAKHLEKKLPGLADIGLDIGIDLQGKPYFIEMNGRDLRYSFGKAGLMKKWYKTYENPMKYGKYLLKTRGL